MNNFEHFITNDAEMRIVMVGRTGGGKSATGNTILGRQCFESKFSAKSITVDCAKGTAVVDGQPVAVIDTPGLFDTRFGVDKTSKDLRQCISYASPGPHIFLVVIWLGRYTEEEKHTVQMIQQIFGQAADRYSMVLFTGGDRLEGSIEEFLGGSPELQELVARCNGQYHVFNNRLKNNGSQVTELLQKIRHVVQKNGGSHYTNEMFQEAERAIEEEKQRILREKEEQIQKEREELERKIQEKYTKMMNKIQKQLQAERERERKEREEERRRERVRQEMERRMEREERKRDSEEREKEMVNKMKQLQERHEKELEEEKRRLQSSHEAKARQEAEETDILGSLWQAAKAIADVPITMGKAFGKLFR